MQKTAAAATGRHSYWLCEKICRGNAQHYYYTKSAPRGKEWNYRNSMLFIVQYARKNLRKTLDVVQYWWYYNDTEKIKANTKGKVKQGFYSKRRKPSSNLKDVNPVWYPRKRWVQWYQKRHLTSSRDSPRRCDRNDQGDSWKNERVPIPQFEPPEKRDRLLSKGNNNGNFGEAILVNLTIRTWHTKTVKRIEAAGK